MQKDSPLFTVERYGFTTENIMVVYNDDNLILRKKYRFTVQNIQENK